jgi:hypothetical protein
MGQIKKICLKDHASFLKIKPYLKPICVLDEKNIFFQKSSQISTRIGSKDQKFQKFQKHIYQLVLMIKLIN